MKGIGGVQDEEGGTSIHSDLHGGDEEGWVGGEGVTPRHIRLSTALWSPLPFHLTSLLIKKTKTKIAHIAREYPQVKLI